MKRKEAETVLNRFFEECGEAVPDQNEIEPVLDRVRERLEWKADELVGAPMPAAQARPFRFAWAVGIVLAAILVNGLIWKQGPPFSVSGKNAGDPSLSKSSTGQDGATLQLNVPSDVFDLASVKLVPKSSDAAKNASQVEAFQLAVSGCADGYVGSARVDPGRLTIPAATVFSLVMTAYGQDCTLVEGGPAWVRSGGDHYEIQALLPPGTPSYTQQDLQRGIAPRLQRMLQNLLADRFQLVLKRELREMPVYALTLANRDKLKLSPDETRPFPASFPIPPGFPPLQPLRRGQMMRLMTPTEVHMFSHAVSISELAKDLRQHAGRVVVDKTGLDGVFDVDLHFARDTALPIPSIPAAPPQATPPPQSIPPLPGAPSVPVSPLPGPPLGLALEDQLGLKLEPRRMPIEVLVIQSVEKPAEN